MGESQEIEKIIKRRIEGLRVEEGKWGRRKAPRDGATGRVVKFGEGADVGSVSERGPSGRGVGQNWADKRLVEAG